MQVRPNFSHRLLQSAAVAAAMALLGATQTACGGGGSSGSGSGSGDDDDADGPAQALKTRPVTIVPLGPNVVSRWNEIAVATASMPASPAGATAPERVPGPDVTTVQLAVYDAVVAITATHKPYAVRPATRTAGASLEAAVVEAAYGVLRGLFPSRGSAYEAARSSDLAALADGDAKTRGIAIGAEVATAMLALRANDGRETVLPPYVPGTLPGQFRGPTPVNRIASSIRPFLTQSHSQFRAPPPYALTSAAYAADLNEVQVMASTTSATRTDAQTEVARFHTEPPGGFWARNLRQFATANLALADNARLLAQLWAVQADAGSACFDSKYHYNFWRPTSAIRLADTDDNPATTADAGWTPVVPTPNHPEYPAAHGCASGSAMEVVRSFYGTKQVTFAFDSTVTGTTHRFDSTDALLREIRNARVWGGMHFRTSAEAGAELGKDVAKWVAKHHFQPVE